MKKFLSGLLFSFLVFAAPAFSGTDEWVNKAVGAAGSIARGDVNGAAYQALPSANIPVKNGNVYASAGGVNYSQPLIPAQKLGPLPAYFNGTYNAYVPVNPFHPTRPNLGQNVNAGVSGKYFSNNTTFSPDNR